MSNRPVANTPKDAAAVILLRHDTDPNNPEVFWIQRSHKLAFLGAYHAFPGGQIDACDAEVDVRNAPNPQTAAIPIVALSAFTMADSSDRARAAGANVCLSKPCLPSQVGRVVRAMLLQPEVHGSIA